MRHSEQRFQSHDPARRRAPQGLEHPRNQPPRSLTEEVTVDAWPQTDEAALRDVDHPFSSDLAEVPTHAPLRGHYYVEPED
jgi:hypothetical protein